MDFLSCLTFQASRELVFHGPCEKVAAGLQRNRRIRSRSARRRMLGLARKGVRVATVALVLAGYGVACIGLPVPKLVEKDRSRPFPCADRSCGCMNADDCWDHCCCFTREQRLAWAVEHGVEVPAWVLNQRPQSGSKLAARAASDKHPGSCCQRNAAAACCQPPAAPKSCCSKSTENTASNAADAPTTEKMEWVIGMMARKCRGQGCDWLAAGAVLPGPLPTLWQPFSPRIGRVALLYVRLTSIERAPPVPPPRLGLVG